MKQIVIENLVINSPFEEPRCHFKFKEEGITDEVVDGRRISEYFVPIPKAKKKNPKQPSFETEWTSDRLEENKFINRVRERVAIYPLGMVFADNFAHMIIENLKKACVQSTYKNDRLEPYAGFYLHAAKEVAKEAVQGLGFDLLIICRFAFAPHVSEEIKRYDTLTVLPTGLNPDLAMGNELLKKTGAGNLFMVFNEPDIEIKRSDNFGHPNDNDLPQGGASQSHYYVTIKSLAIYEPTTGEIRSNSTDDIACRFIDTNYNGELFIVCQAYFSGTDKLKRALRSEIDESAWSALYQATSYPFEKPESGKVAVKVINHYGGEV